MTVFWHCLCQVLADKTEAEIKLGHVIFPEEHLAAFYWLILLSQQVSLCSLRATREECLLSEASIDPLI